MVRIILDSVSSVPADVAAMKGIEIVPLFLHFDDADHIETEMDIPRFYETIDERIDDIPTSSQPSAHVFETLFEDAAIAGDSVVGVFLSSDLSGTFDGALRAARIVKSRNLEFECAVVDSTSAGYDEAFAAFDAADARDAGDNFEEVVSAAAASINRSRILFVPESLAFLKAGGRIGAVSALLGQVIQMSPILTVRDGKPVALAKVRTLKKAIASMLETFKSDIAEHGLKRVVVHYIGKKSKYLEQLVSQVSEIAGFDVDVHPVSPVLGAHVGPAVGMAYECCRDIDGKLTDNSRQVVLNI